MLEHEARDFGRPVPEIIGNNVKDHSVLTMLVDLNKKILFMLEHEASDFGRPVPEIMGNSVREHPVLTMLVDLKKKKCYLC
jgi:hypothetical protein